VVLVVVEPVGEEGEGWDFAILLAWARRDVVVSYIATANTACYSSFTMEN